jgi:hypothetical protein
LTQARTEQPNKEATPAWQEQYAYTLGVQAYVYGFPWVYLPTLRWLWVTQPKDPANTPYAALNHFWHKRDVANASYKDGGSPNNDTLYSSAWVDVAKEPVILSVPDEGNRYYTMEMASMDSDNFAYVGKRTTGTKAGNYAIVGPNWKGKLPNDVKALDPSRTSAVLILGRTLVSGEADLPKVHKIQDEYKLTPLSLWGKNGVPLPENRDVWAPFDAKSDSLAEWKTMNRAMTENPPPDTDRKLLKLFATIGIGPGQNVDSMDEASKRGLAHAAADGRALIAQMLSAGGTSQRVNGWSYPPKTIGRAGIKDDFVTRASIQCLGGIIANDPEEAVYLNTFTSYDQSKLTGEKQYTLHFGPKDTPKVSAFWSMTMYGMDYNLVDNPLNRYSIGDRTSGLKPDADGGLTLYVQHASPGHDKEANWLPAPEGGFYLILRTYMPSAEIVEQTWKPPALNAVNHK